VNNKRS